MATFQPFEMERMMSRFEQRVEYNLSESGVHPVSLHDLLSADTTALDRLMATELNYPHVNGKPELRDAIAAMYNGATRDNVLVTVGAIEANYITMHTLLDPGDEVVIMLPNYMQIWGIARNHGLAIKTFRLREDRGWSVDLDELAAAVSAKTKLIAICNPDNPTGYILTETEMAAIVDAADRVGAWILADEVYAGAERLSDEQTPSFYGSYDKVIAVGSLSKAYGLPGLRLGWAVGPPAVLDEIWARHEYTTLAATILSNELAALALSPAVRPGLIRRTRNYIRQGFPELKRWAGQHGETFSFVEPQAAAIAFIRYNLAINSTELVNRLCAEQSVLVVPGDHFGMDNFLRISFGLPHDYLRPALARISDCLDVIRGS
jgi:aspartate/methionine/tyrosine aminotransferase